MTYIGTLYVDDKYLAEGSFNWLSASRKNYLHNVTFGYKGENVKKFIRQAAEELENIEKTGIKK